MQWLQASILSPLLGVIIAAFSVPLCLAEPAFESPSDVRASEVLPRNLRSGRGFSVEEKVKSDGYLYQFTVGSTYGAFVPRGKKSLEYLVYEFRVLNDLEQFTDSKVFIDASKASGIAIATAPVRVVKSLSEAAAEPEKTWDTVKKVPEGIVGVFRWGARQVGAGVSAAGRAVGKSGAEKDSTVSELTEQGTEAALDYIGYNAKEMEWYKKYGLDPYTSNQPLRDKISRIVAVESAVKLGFKFVPGLWGLGVVSEAHGYWEKTKMLAAYADPEKQGKINRSMLEQMGVSKDDANRFCDNKNYTPAFETLFVQSLERLSNVPNSDALVRISSGVKSREGAFFFTRAVAYLADIHNKGEPLSGVVRGAEIPTAVSRQGVIIIPLPLDELLWTGDVATVLDDILRDAKSSFRGSKSEIRIEGKVSQRLKTETRSRGCAVKEGVVF